MSDDVLRGETSEVVVNRDGQSRARLIARIRREVAESWTGPTETSAADELISERRAEAARVQGVR